MFSYSDECQTKKKLFKYVNKMLPLFRAVVKFGILTSEKFWKYFQKEFVRTLCLASS